MGLFLIVAGVMLLLFLYILFKATSNKWKDR